MSKDYFSFAGREQIIEIEKDSISKDAIIHFHPCENVVQTVKVSKQEFEKAMFNALKNMYFSNSK